MAEQLYSKCEICGEEGVLRRKYFYYDIKCECHSPRHFEMVEHCILCIPKEPEKTTVYIKPFAETVTSKNREVTHESNKAF